MAKITVDPNMDLELEVVKVEAAEASAASGIFTGVALVFSIETGNLYTITATGIGTATFAVGDTIVINGSVNAGGTINNDGVYTVTVVSANYLEVAEPVVAATSDASGNTVDEYDRYEITPTRRMGQTCIFMKEAGGVAGANFSLAPGDFWAAGVALTGTLTESKVNLLQVETAKYLDAAGKLQLSIFPVAGGAFSAHTITVGFIQLK